MSVIAFPSVLVISKRKRLFDSPSERKVHTRAIPRLGGLVFFPAIFFSFVITVGFADLFQLSIIPPSIGQTSIQLLFLLGGCFLIYMLGAKDDLIGVSFYHKFMVQFIIGFLLCCSGLYIDNLYGLFGVYGISPYVGIPLSVLLIVFIMNAINLLDGIDGLVAGICLLEFVIFALFFAFEGDYLFSILALSVAGCLIPFGYYNCFSSGKRKLFMGDCGSLTMGFLSAFFSIKYAISLSTYHTDGFNLIIPLSLLIVPAFDTLRVVFVRAWQHKPLFLPDRCHIHHKCLDAGLSHLGSTILLLSFTIGVLCLNLYVGNKLNVTFLFLLDLSLWCLLNMSLDVSISNKKRLSAEVK